MNNYNFFDTFNMPEYTLYGAYEGYLKGNMYSNIYEQYKNYKPANIIPKTEKEQDLFNLNQIGFAMHDINLYLDVNPNDQQMLNLFTKYKDMYNQLFTQYESKYGPISVNNTGNQIPFEWENKKYPWEVM